MSKDDIERLISSMQADPAAPADVVAERISRLQAVLRSASANGRESLQDSAAVFEQEVDSPPDRPTLTAEQSLSPPSVPTLAQGGASSPSSNNSAAAASSWSNATSGTPSWLSEMFSLAAQFNDPWLPSHSEGLYGWNLTGTWSCGYPGYEVNLYQYGTYIIWMGHYGGRPSLYARCMLDPTRWLLHVVGSYVVGGIFHAQLQLYSDWTLYGSATGVDPSGHTDQRMLRLQKIG